MTGSTEHVLERAWLHADRSLGLPDPAGVLAWARTASVRGMLDLAEAGLEGELRIARELSEQAPTCDYFAWCAEIREALRLVRQARDLQAEESFARLGELLGEPPPKSEEGRSHAAGRSGMGRAERR